jgi:hypothetical protein
MPLLFASFPDSRKSSQLLEGYTATGDEVARPRPRHHAFPQQDGASGAMFSICSTAGRA